MTPVKSLALYHYIGCGFCMRVMSAIDALGIRVDDRNIHQDPRHRDTLRAATGRTTVPVLHIEYEDGQIEWMPESRDIIRYLQQNADRLPH